MKTLFISALLLLSTSQLYAYETAISDCRVLKCTFEKKAEHGSYAFYVVKVESRSNSYGELVDLRTNKGLNFLGSQPSCGLQECTSGTSITDGHFVKTRYGNTLAVSNVGLSVDLCGVNRPIGYLSEAPGALPRSLNPDYVSTKLKSIVGSTVNFTQYNTDFAVEFDEDVIEVTPVGLRLASGGSRTGVFRVEMLSAVRYFYITSDKQNYPGYKQEHFINPDNTFSFAGDQFCTK